MRQQHTTYITLRFTETNAISSVDKPLQSLCAKCNQDLNKAIDISDKIKIVQDTFKQLDELDQKFSADSKQKEEEFAKLAKEARSAADHYLRHDGSLKKGMLYKRLEQTHERFINGTQYQQFRLDRQHIDLVKGLLDKLMNQLKETQRRNAAAESKLKQSNKQNSEDCCPRCNSTGLRVKNKHKHYTYEEAREQPNLHYECFWCGAEITITPSHQKQKTKQLSEILPPKNKNGETEKPTQLQQQYFDHSDRNYNKNALKKEYDLVKTDINDNDQIDNQKSKVDCIVPYDKLLSNYNSTTEPYNENYLQEKLEEYQLFDSNYHSTTEPSEPYNESKEVSDKNNDDILQYAKNDDKNQQNTDKTQKANVQSSALNLHMISIRVEVSGMGSFIDTIKHGESIDVDVPANSNGETLIRQIKNKITTQFHIIEDECNLRITVAGKILTNSREINENWDQSKGNKWTHKYPVQCTISSKNNEDEMKKEYEEYDLVENDINDNDEIDNQKSKVDCIVPYDKLLLKIKKLPHVQNAIKKAFETSDDSYIYA